MSGRRFRGPARPLRLQVTGTQREGAKGEGFYLRYVTPEPGLPTAEPGVSLPGALFQTSPLHRFGQLPGPHFPVSPPERKALPFSASYPSSLVPFHSPLSPFLFCPPHHLPLLPPNSKNPRESLNGLLSGDSPSLRRQLPSESWSGGGGGRIHSFLTEGSTVIRRWWALRINPNSLGLPQHAG